MSVFQTGWDYRKTLIAVVLGAGVVAVVLKLHAPGPARSPSTIQVLPPVWEPEPPGTELKPRPSDNQYEGALRPFRDGGEIPYGGSYEYLIRYLSRQDPEEFAKGIPSKYLDYNLVLHDPERFRGQPVRLFGVLRRVDVEKIEITPGNRRDIWRGWLPDPSGTEGFMFQAFEPLPSTLKRDGSDLVEVEGIFLQIYGFVGANGKRQQAPFVLARTVRRVEAEDVKRSPPSLGSGQSSSLLLVPMVLLPLGAYVVIRIMMARKFTQPRSHRLSR
jgi:hypothetical protein